MLPTLASKKRSYIFSQCRPIVFDMATKSAINRYKDKTNRKLTLRLIVSKNKISSVFKV